MELITRYQNSAGERVRIALNLKGIAYRYRAVASLPTGAYPALNPQGLLPALVVGGEVIAQSAAILAYLEEVHPSPALLPADPILRAQARAFAQSIAADLHPLNNQRVRRFLADRLGVEAAGLGEWYRHWVGVGLTGLEAVLAARGGAHAFCFGDAPGWADLHLVPQLANARRFDCDLTAYPLLLAIDGRCRAMDAFRRARPEEQPDFPRVR